MMIVSLLLLFQVLTLRHQNVSCMGLVFSLRAEDVLDEVPASSEARDLNQATSSAGLDTTCDHVAYSC